MDLLNLIQSLNCKIYKKKKLYILIKMNYVQLIELIQQERIKRIKEMERIYKIYYPW